MPVPKKETHMKKYLIIVLLMTVATLAFAEEKPQTTCPVMEGQRIIKKLYADVDGYRIYVCCRACVAAIQTDPKKYIEQMKADGVEPEKTPKKSDATSGATKKWKNKKS